jgi:large subunit ribosomal protein L22
MSEQKYAFQEFNKENMAKAIAKNLAISTKKTLEVCTSIRGKTVKSARTYLNRVLKMQDSIKYRRFNQELAHNQRGPGGYPINAIKEVLTLIKNAEANAKSKGLNTEALKIVHVVANRGGKAWHYGRQKRRLQKRTHLEIILQETKAKKAEKKIESKKEDKKIEAPAKKVEEKKTEAPIVEEKKVEKKDEKTDAKEESTEDKK